MYDKYLQELESCKNVILSMAGIAIAIWLLNGGINDSGIIHHITVYRKIQNKPENPHFKPSVSGGSSRGCMSCLKNN